MRIFRVKVIRSIRFYRRLRQYCAILVSSSLLSTLYTWAYRIASNILAQNHRTSSTIYKSKSQTFGNNAFHFNRWHCILHLDAGRASSHIRIKSLRNWRIFFFENVATAGNRATWIEIEEIGTTWKELNVLHRPFPKLVKVSLMGIANWQTNDVTEMLKYNPQLREIEFHSNKKLCSRNSILPSLVEYVPDIYLFIRINAERISLDREYVKHFGQLRKLSSLTQRSRLHNFSELHD